MSILTIPQLFAAEVEGVSSYSVVSLLVDERSEDDVQDGESFHRHRVVPIKQIEFIFEPSEGISSERSEVPKLTTREELSIKSEFENLTVEDLRKHTKLMLSSEYQESLKHKIIVPLSSSKIEDVDSLLEKIDEVEISKFLAEKAKLLNYIVKLSMFMAKIKEKSPFKNKIDYTKINKMIESVNNDLFLKADLLAREKVIVANIGVMNASGFGLPDKIMDFFNKKIKGKHFTNRLGFYFYFSLGFSVLVQKKDGKLKIRIFPTMDFKRASKIFSPFLVFSGGIVSTISIQELKPKFIQKTSFYSTPVTTLLSRGDMTGFTIPSGAVNLFPAGGWLMALSGDMTRVNFDWKFFKEMIGNMKGISLKHLRNGRGKIVSGAVSCKATF